MSVVYDQIGVDLRSKATENALTADDAKELIGWQEESDGPKKGFGSRFKLKCPKAIGGQKVRLAKATSNRPFRLGLAMKYANEMLKKKWALNGETIIIDKHGQVQSGQHRLVGLILAEMIRKVYPEWKEQWRGQVTIDTFIVTGVSQAAEVVDTLDLGQKRSLSDVIFRNREFGKEISEREAKKLSSTLQTAIKLVWERSSGPKLGAAAKDSLRLTRTYLPHSEALDFLEEHQGLLEAVQEIHRIEGKERLISGYLSLGFASGLLYLMQVSETDPDKYFESGVESLRWTYKKKAVEFWEGFAQGVGSKADGSPLFALRTLLPKIPPGGNQGRMEVLGTVVKAFNLWTEGKKASTVKDIRIKKQRSEDGGLVLAETPRIGGIDVELELEEESEPEPKEGAKGPFPWEEGEGKKPERASKKPKKPAPPTRGKRAGKKWAASDTCWVKDNDGDWFGTVLEVYTTETDPPCDLALVKNQKDGKEWEVMQELLQLTKPQ